jgi:hypothetical protein
MTMATLEDVVLYVAIIVLGLGLALALARRR